MATEVARLIATLEADTKRFERDLRKAEDRLTGLERQTRKTDDSQRKLGKGFDKAKLAMTAFAVGAGVVAIDFMKDSVRSASDLNESINAVNVTFGKSAEGILELGRNAAESVGLANSEFNSLAVGFSAFVEQIDQGQGNVVQIMDTLTTRIADFASVMNLDIPAAAEKFRAGLAGETEPLRQFGIDVSAAAVNTKALELGLAATTSELTEGDKILARYQLIMEQTEKTAGDFANTSDDLANNTRIFKAELEDARAEIGTALLPVLSDLVSTGRDLIPMLVKVADAVGVLLKGLAILAANGDVERLKVQTGGAAESAEFLATKLVLMSEQVTLSGRRQREFTEDLRAFTREAGSTPEAIGAVIRNLDFLREAFGLSVVEVELAADVLQDELVRALADARGEALSFARGGLGPARKEMKGLKEAADADRVLKQYADRLEDMGDKATNAVPGMRELAGAQRAVNNAAKEAAHPVFAAIGALQRLEDATEEGNADFFEMASLTLDAQAALSDLGASGFGLERALKAIADAMDVPISQVAQMLEDLGILNATDWSVNLLFDISMPAADKALLNSIRTVAGSSTGRVTSVQELIKGTRQHGGPVIGGQPYLVGEAGPELFVPSQSGSVVPNISLTQNFQRVAGDHIESDISRGILLSGIGRFIEASPR